jgi:hypothetical protein
VVPRIWDGAHNGYIDMDQDDFGEKLQPWMHKMQEDVLKTCSLDTITGKGQP